MRSNQDNNCTKWCIWGGGGGSFVATSSSNTPLIVAGGGGGIMELYIRLTNCDANCETSGRQNACEGNCTIWSAGVNGNGAMEADDGTSGGGGGGFYSNGRSSFNFGWEWQGYGGQGGTGFIQGGSGGRSNWGYAVGGFGGAGGAGGGKAGEGAGGYSGGASGDDVPHSCGGGGGSYNIGKNQENKEGFNSNGHGYVEIELLD